MSEWRDSNEVYTWVFMIEDSNGYPMRVLLQATDAYRATEQARAMYGNRLLSEYAALA